MFHFKKFSIDDSTAAMKVGTDAVLLGAWAPCKNETRILDIGTGTGILALMMAQRNHGVQIDAVEINHEASTLAIQNVKLSPWEEYIHIHNISIQEFSITNNYRYSLIISNPPFFTDSLKALDKARNIARHNDTLRVRDLLKITSELLSEKGKAVFIFPADAFENWKAEAFNQSLYFTSITGVKSSPIHKPHRLMIVLSKEENLQISDNVICIYISKKTYSNEYRDLTQEFYLNF